MLQGYLGRGMTDTAVFEFFVRRLPATRNYLVAAGLEQVLEYLGSLAFGDEDIDSLSRTGLFGETFLASLRSLTFTGDVDAMPEGSVFFPDEPVLRVTAPLPEAQLVESRLINLLHFQTLVASKASRCVRAAGGRTLVDFGMRRAHGAEAALYAARASYLAGFAGTATVLAGTRFGIPVFGTMAHSFIQAHDSEADAFEGFARSHRGTLTLLIDTYDPEIAARRVVDLKSRLARDGIAIEWVRIDSGDLDGVSRRVRSILDEGHCEATRIFASGGLDELQIEALVGQGAPIDAFGVGTTLDVSADAPALDCVYKLQEYAGVARRKRSASKTTWPGRKQVFRQLDGSGRLVADTVALVDEDQPGVALLAPVVRHGERVAPPESLSDVRERVARQLASLAPELHALDRQVAYPVTMSPALVQLVTDTDT
ncbi:MAG: nicotinate phosphoribosyltransferase, partial [Gammaproteobacteria bacterium]